jgi:hypothetical protein
MCSVEEEEGAGSGTCYSVQSRRYLPVAARKLKMAEHHVLLGTRLPRGRWRKKKHQQCYIKVEGGAGLWWY